MQSFISRTAFEDPSLRQGMRKTSCRALIWPLRGMGFEQETSLCFKPLGLGSRLLWQQNSAEPGTKSQVGDADARLRERVAEEDRLTAVSHSRAGALSHLPVQEEGGREVTPPSLQDPQGPGLLASP